jgi:hypothetical protein
MLSEALDHDELVAAVPAFIFIGSHREAPEGNDREW